MYRRLSNLRTARLMSRLVDAKPLDDKASAGWTTYGTWRAAMLLPHPPVEIFTHELIVVQARIAIIDAINLFHLPG